MGDREQEGEQDMEGNREGEREGERQRNGVMEPGGRGSGRMRGARGGIR